MYHERNLEYLEGQLEGHRHIQRSKMEVADRQALMLCTVVAWPPPL